MKTRHIWIIVGIAVILLGGMIVLASVLETIQDERAQQELQSDQSQSDQQAENNQRGEVLPTTQIERSFLTPFEQGPTIYQETDEYLERQASIAAEVEPALLVDQEVATLRVEAPHEIDGVVLEYSYDQLSFVATIPENDLEDGNQRLDDFLAERGLTREDLRGLLVQYE